MTDAIDERPPVALGHVGMRVNKLGPATDFLERLGLRVVNRGQTLSVLEFRGGTHLVLRETEDDIEPGTVAPIDLMVDDVEATHGAYAGMGLEPSEITAGTIHSSFTIPGPDGYRIKITSSHAGGRPV